MKRIHTIDIQPKWYLSAALIFIAVLGGIFGQQQTTLPNQEIVLQFTDADISSSEAQQTLAIVEQQLERIGVGYIQVSEQEDGKMVISYYSNANVESIKVLLSKQKELALGFIANKKTKLPLQLPSHNEGISYNLDVYEIQDGHNAVSDLNGRSALELKSGQYRFVNPNFYIPTEITFVETNAPVLKLKVAVQQYIAITKDHDLHKIPEVRAGPTV